MQQLREKIVIRGQMNRGCYRKQFLLLGEYQYNERLWLGRHYGD